MINLEQNFSMLSKSKVIRGMQCSKSLWLYTHQYKLQDKVDAAQQAIFDTGNQVGALAQQFWPTGVDASAEQDYPNILSAKQTQRLLADGQEVIFEATFVYDDTLIAVDVLAKEDGVWNAYEVKSSTSVKDVNYDDAAVQYYVMLGAGIDVQNISIVHINNEYVRDGRLDIYELFSFNNITEAVVALQAEIKTTLNDLHQMLKGPMPEVRIGTHCSDPYGCSFMGHCWQHVADYSIFNVSRLSAEKTWDLYNQGILDVKDIPDDYPLSENQRMQVAYEKSQESFIDQAGIREYVKGLNYPLYFLDYETINPAIPMFDGLKPYVQMPFQYSLHVQHDKEQGYTHFEYLAPTNGTDPRKEFVQKLIEDCGAEGDILVYNIGFERSKTEALADAFPKNRKALISICNRMKDLMQPFQQKLYYTPAMRGRYSIKTVLPALVPELSYDELPIGDGGMASAVFKSYFVGQHELPVDTNQNLLDYCKLDTWAMVKILEKLKEI